MVGCGQQNIPLEYIIYRAIIYFSEIKTYIEDKNILEKLDKNPDYVMCKK